MVTASEDDSRDKTHKNSSNSLHSKKTKSIPILIIVIILSIAIGLVILFFGLTLLFGLTSPFFKVVSESMIPTLQVNDTIIVRHIPFSELKVGDIIVFYSPYNNSRVIVHRIIDRFEIVNTAINHNNNSNGNETIIRTQGDASSFSIFGIDYPIREHNYIGKVVYHISYTDPWFLILRPPIIQLIILATLSIISGTILYKVFNRISQRRAVKID